MFKALRSYPVNVSALPRASETVMAADCMGTAAGKSAALRTGHYDDGTRDLFALGNKGHLLDPPRLRDGDSDYADPEARAPEHRSAPDPRHAGRANVVFCDGHVEYHKQAEWTRASDNVRARWNNDHQPHPETW